MSSTLILPRFGAGSVPAMPSRRRSLTWPVLLLSLWLLLGFGSMCPTAAWANPTVPQGGSASFAKTGTDAPAASVTWDIVRQGASVATSAAPNGWSVSYNMSAMLFTVGAPATAAIAVNYEVRYNGMVLGTCFQPSSAEAGLESLLLEPAGSFQPVPPPGSIASAYFDVVMGTGVQVSSLSLNPTSVVGGSASTATVTLSAAAPLGGASVTLASSNTGVATVPASVAIAAGQLTGTFTVSTQAVAATTNVTISATYGSTVTATLTVTPPANTGGITVTLNPATVFAGQLCVGTVTLAQPAPAGGTTISLAGSPVTPLSMPATVGIAQGQTTGTFNINTSGVSIPAVVTITATSMTASGSAVLTINVLKPLPAVTNLRCTNLTIGSIRVDWDYAPPTPNVATHFVWTRTWLPP